MKEIRLKTSPDYKIWFVSDLHVGHAKDFILKPRSYTAVQEAMDHTFKMVYESVGPNDILFNLGDAVCGAGANTMAYAKRVMTIPCRHQYFLWGNHNAGMNEIYTEACNALYPGVIANGQEIYPLTCPNTNFTFLGDYCEVQIDHKKLALFHYPIASWNGLSDQGFMVHGHCHRKLKEDKTLQRLDVSWEWKRRPVEWTEIYNELKGIKTVAPDHHGADTKQFFE